MTEPPPRSTCSRTVGAPALRRHRLAVGRAAREGRAEGRDRRAGSAHVAASDHGRARPLRLLHHRALVLPRAPRAHRSGRRAPPQGARQCRPAARGQRRRPTGRARAVCRPQELERPAPSRQPRRAGRDATRAQAGAVLSDAAPLHEGQRPRQAPAPHVTHDRRRRARRGPPRRSRDPQLRGRVCRMRFGIGTATIGSRKVLTARGEWATPILFGVLDDRSRLACHLQWYLAETAEIIAHGLPRRSRSAACRAAALSDNGAAMTAAEITRRARPPRHPAPDDACRISPIRTPSRRPSGARSKAG